MMLLFLYNDQLIIVVFSFSSFLSPEAAAVVRDFFLDGDMTASAFPASSAEDAGAFRRRPPALDLGGMLVLSLK